KFEVAAKGRLIFAFLGHLEVRAARWLRNLGVVHTSSGCVQEVEVVCAGRPNQARSAAPRRAAPRAVDSSTAPQSIAWRSDESRARMVAGSSTTSRGAPGGEPARGRAPGACAPAAAPAPTTSPGPV